MGKLVVLAAIAATLVSCDTRSVACLGDGEIAEVLEVLPSGYQVCGGRIYTCSWSDTTTVRVRRIADQTVCIIRPSHAIAYRAGDLIRGPR